MKAARRAIARVKAAPPALLAAGAILAMALPGSAPAAEASGGIRAPTAGIAFEQPVNAAGVGGAEAPVSKGTGGSEYGVAQASSKKPSATHRVAHRSAHGRHGHSRKPRPALKAAPKPAPKPSPKPAPSPAPAPSPGVATPAQTVGEGAVFPVQGGPHNFGGPENRFGAPRSGHIHQGQDILAAEGLPDVAAMAGTIITTGYQAGGAGWYVVEHSANFDLFYAHCQAGSVTVSAGQAVAAGTTLCKLGATGDATGPHLHFEMWVGGWHGAGGYPIDPLPYLEAWEA
jgi:murein DD-endopeptidase MepM/ murein hydrolase activator NlpD